MTALAVPAGWIGNILWTFILNPAPTLPEYPICHRFGYTYVVSTWGKTKKQIEAEFARVRVHAEPFVVSNRTANQNYTMHLGPI